MEKTNGGRYCNGCKHLFPHMTGGDCNGEGQECEGHYCDKLETWVDLVGVNTGIKKQCMNGFEQK